MKFKGIIFDLDGVICSTDHYHYLSWKKIADKLGIDFDEEKNNLLRGVSRMESLEIILSLGNNSEVFSQEEKEKLAEEKNFYYRELLKEMSPNDLSSEVENTLEILKKNSYMLAIGSSSKNARFILERLGLNNFFDVIVDGTDIINSKPDPEVFLKAAALLNLSVGDCVVVEDAVAGVQSALSGNFQVIAIGDAVKSNLATYNISTFSDIINNI